MLRMRAEWHYRAEIKNGTRTKMERACPGTRLIKPFW